MIQPSFSTFLNSLSSIFTWFIKLVVTLQVNRFIINSNRVPDHFFHYKEIQNIVLFVCRNSTVAFLFRFWKTIESMFVLLHDEIYLNIITLLERSFIKHRCTSLSEFHFHSISQDWNLSRYSVSRSLMFLKQSEIIMQMSMKSWKLIMLEFFFISRPYHHGHHMQPYRCALVFTSDNTGTPFLIDNFNKSRKQEPLLVLAQTIVSPYQ